MKKNTYVNGFFIAIVGIYLMYSITLGGFDCCDNFSIFISLLVIYISLSTIITFGLKRTELISFYNAFIIYFTLYLSFPVVLAISIMADIVTRVVNVLNSSRKSFFDGFLTKNMPKSIGLVAVYLSHKYLMEYTLIHVVFLSLVYMIVSTIVSNIINISKNGCSVKANLFELFFVVISNVVAYVSYSEYGFPGIIVVFLFMMSFEGYIITQVIPKKFRSSLYMDPLTKVNSRGFLDETLSELLEKKEPFSLVFIDFDDFKIINDKYNHSVGDEVLIDFVGNLKKIVRKKDCIFRFGGDEFCILIENLNDLIGIMNRLMDIKRTLIYINDEHSIRYSFSIGEYYYDGKNVLKPSDVLKHASKLMKIDKSENKEIKQ